MSIKGMGAVGQSCGRNSKADKGRIETIYEGTERIPL